jgi:hypothetical protein
MLAKLWRLCRLDYRDRDDPGRELGDPVDLSRPHQPSSHILVALGLAKLLKLPGHWLERHVGGDA